MHHIHERMYILKAMFMIQYSTCLLSLLVSDRYTYYQTWSSLPEGCQICHPNWARLAPNRTNLGFSDQIPYILAHRRDVYTARYDVRKVTCTQQDMTSDK